MLFTLSLVASTAFDYPELWLNLQLTRQVVRGLSPGDGVEKDPEESRKLLEIAATRGNGRARGVLQQVIQHEMAREQKPNVQEADNKSR